MAEHKDRKLPFSSHPDWPAVYHIVKTLQDNGYEALLAGGAVRDALMGKTPGDLDVATKAEPDQVEKLFPQTVAVGKAFGVIRVITHGKSIEVATYRLDQNYKDGRRPEAVVFTSRLEDAKRRDFTINALYYDIIHNVLYDDVEGLKDLENKILRAVGDASKRFQEDELRRLRLIRFVAQLGYEIEEQTWRAVKSGIEGLQKISRERITEETTKMWKAPHLKKAFSLWLESKMGEQVDQFWKNKSVGDFPELVWSWKRSTIEEAWAHFFSFYWLKSEPWEEALESFKLSKDLQNKLRKACEIFQLGAKFTDLSWGEQRIFWQEALAPWALQASYGLKNKESELSQLKFKLDQAGALPEPLLRGQDLLKDVQGARLGEILKSAYLEQLNQNWTSKDQALRWVQTQRLKPV